MQQRVIHPLFGAQYGEGEQYLALWPLLLDKPSGSTEAAAALAQILLFAVKRGERKNDLGETWQENSVFPIIEKTQESRPADFMIRNLCQGVKDKLSRLPPDAKSAKELIEYLEGFLVRIKQNCQKIADIAPDFVGLNDILVVHGYCKNIAAFLERLSGRGNNALYIVIYDEFDGRAKVGSEENERISSFAERLGFREVRYLTLSAFAEVLNNLGVTPCKVLLGTHGVLKDRELRCTDFLCKVGSYTLALVAREAKKRGVNVRVVVFAEKMKFLTNGESDEKVAGHEAFFSTLEYRRDTQSIHKVYALPKIDFLRKDFVDDVLTEDGVVAVSDLRASGE